MNRVQGCVLLVVAVGCTSGGGVKAMGDRAPVFGSTPELSSMQGFVVGTWREPHLSSGEGQGNSLVNRIADSEHAILTVNANGTAALSIPEIGKHVAHGTWTAGGNRADFSFKDVDGLSFERVIADVEKRRRFNEKLWKVESYVRRDSFRTTDEGIEGDRDRVRSACETFKGLAVAEDGKRLIWAENVGREAEAEAGPFGGMVIWEKISL